MSMQQVLSDKPTISPQELINYFGLPPYQIYRLIKRSIITLAIGEGLVVSLIACAALFTPTISLAFILSAALWLLIFGIPLSIPLAIGYIRLRMYNAKPRPTDEEYNTWVNSWRPAIRQYGLQKLGLEPGDIIGEPLYVRGIIWPNFWEAKYYYNHGCPVQIKHGRDGRPHSSVYRFTFFYPTQHYIAVFSGDVNALGPLRFESTRTYFYDDIVGVETEAFGIPLDTVTYTMQRFELRVSSGQSVGATTYAQEAPVDRAVQSLRVLLRDKKYGIKGGGYGLAGS